MVIVRPSEPIDYERVKNEEWVNSKITEVQTRVNAQREGNPQEVRFVFEIEGCEYKHYSRWMTAVMAEKANLYVKYIQKLAPKITPDKIVDLQRLVGLKLQTMWQMNKSKNGKEYQNLAMIRAVDTIPDLEVKESGGGEHEPESKDLPF